MACPAQDITETELSILGVLWKSGPLTTRSISAVLYPGGGSSHYATVQSLLGRLEEKGFVRRRRGDRALIFEAAVEREDVIGRRLKDLVETLCEGSLSPVLTHLIRARKLTAAERKELRRILDEMEKAQKAPRGKG